MNYRSRQNNPGELIWILDYGSGDEEIKPTFKGLFTH